MLRDIRGGEARFYDLNPNLPDDIPFFLERLPSPDPRVLELGFGQRIETECRDGLGVRRFR